MGIEVTANGSKHTFYMGYGGFFLLRKNIAKCLDKEFGENYEDLGKCFTKAQFETNDRIAESIINRKKLDESHKDVLDFLYMSDCGGQISYKVCGEIYNLIKDADFSGKGFRYQAYRNDDYEEFKEFLKECYSKRRKNEVVLSSLIPKGKPVGTVRGR